MRWTSSIRFEGSPSRPITALLDVDCGNFTCVFLWVFFKFKREFSAGVTERMDAGVSYTQWSWTSSFSHSLDNRRDESFFYCACFLFTFMHKELSLPQVTVSHSHSLLHYSRLDRTDTELCWQTLIGWISFMLLSPDQDWILRQVRFHINRVAFRNRSGFIRLCVWSTTDVVNRPA